MSFRFRKTVKLLPGVRLNLSGSGASVSFGPRGLHYTVGMKGTRATVGIPGSGLSWTSYQSFSSSRSARSAESARPAADSPPPNAEPALGATPTRSFESAEIQQLVARSTSELAPLLDAARKRPPSHLLVPAVAGTVF